MSSAFWELFCIEHGIDPEGCPVCFEGQSGDDLDEGRDVFFEETESGGFSPRTVIMDSEPLVIDEIRAGVYRSLFNPQRLLSGSEDGAGNYARGFYQLASQHAPRFAATLRRVAETCDLLEGVCFFHSYGGGTGSGLLMALHDTIDGEYPKANKLDLGVYPDYDQALSVLEPYNAVLGAASPYKPDCISLVLQNRAIMDIYERELNVACVTYSHINRLLAQVYSGLTAGFRFYSSLTSSLVELQTNLIPYPSMHYLMCSFYPLMSPAVYDSTKLTAEMLLQEALSDRFQLALGVSPIEDSVMLSCALLYRGDVTPSVINAAVDEWKQSGRLKFADWSPCGYKIGCCRQPMVVIKATGMVATPLCITALYNGTLVKSTLTGIGNDFIALKNRKAFYYWYLYEGMEECEFDEALNDFQSLLQDYEIIDESAKKAIKKMMSLLDQVSTSCPKSSDGSQATRSCLKGPTLGTTFYIDKSATSTSSPRYTGDYNGPPTSVCCCEILQSSCESQRRPTSSRGQSSKPKRGSEPRHTSCQRDTSLQTPSTDGAFPDVSRGSDPSQGVTDCRPCSIYCGTVQQPSMIEECLQNTGLERRSSAYYRSNQRDECGAERSPKKKTPSCGIQSPSSSERCISSSDQRKVESCTSSSGQRKMEGLSQGRRQYECEFKGQPSSCGQKKAGKMCTPDKSLNETCQGSSSSQLSPEQRPCYFYASKRNCQIRPQEPVRNERPRTSLRQPDPCRRTPQNQMGSTEIRSSQCGHEKCHRPPTMEKQECSKCKCHQQRNRSPEKRPCSTNETCMHRARSPDKSRRGRPQSNCAQYDANQKTSPFLVKSRHRTHNSEKTLTDSCQKRETKQSASPFFRKFRQKKRTPEKTSPDTTPNSSPCKRFNQKRAA
ncbi:alpha tubulin [Echinococcus multilocularis]|uniref:Alpha tubulin n=1 Tax=Echinococcus multilocularis TaxID=6211 RepID=A0A068XW44_ECHMU|nr:alpha tubulin [Echinococcus multilocularis]